MSKFVRAAALSLAMLTVTLLVVSIDPPAAPAQAKKKVETEVKGTVEIFQDAKEQFRFRIKGEDGKTIADSVKGYAKKEDCDKALATVKEILTNVKPVVVKGEKAKDK